MEVLLLAGLAAACAPEPAPVRTPEGPAAVTPFAGAVDQAPRQELLAYAQGQSYDAGYGAGDVQALGTAAGTRGPVVRIEPVTGAFAFSRADLAQGRVLGRMTNVGATAYPRLALAAGGTTYWWVDSTAAGWRSLFIPSDSQLALGTAPFRIDRSSPDTAYEWRQSIARWGWLAAGEQPWITCDRWYCCSAALEHP